jgi:predicted nucleic acid-binding protein
LILVDTSVWVDRLRAGDGTLSGLRENGRTGELALGNLRQREVVLDALLELPQATVASDEEVLHFIDRLALFRLGIGYIDAHLLPPSD